MRRLLALNGVRLEEGAGLFRTLSPLSIAQPASQRLLSIVPSSYGLLKTEMPTRVAVSPSISNRQLSNVTGHSPYGSG